jgi:signal transduction histidine kinase
MSDRVDILIVDDNPAKVLALETALAPLDQNLVAVHSGRDALRQLLTRSFATVILDVNMPGMDGFETAQLIRGRPASAGTPIIFVSAINLSEADALRGYALGAVDYIAAPIVPEILRAKVSVFVELHRKTEEARRHLRQVEQRTQELQASQQQLRLAERMAALGTLSAGVGHDMGNLLLPIQAQIEFLDSAGLEGETLEAVRSIGVCVKHLRRLASGLRLLAMDPERAHTSQESTNLAEWWPEIEPVLKNVLPSGAALTFGAPEGTPRILIAPHLLGQAVFNLVQNAADALRASGKVGTVRIWASPEPDRRRVHIGVSDDGPGMTEEVQRRCLEPFFTTKARGLSTGLGLSLVHGIVQRAGGELTVQSRLGEGTTFAFWLVAAEHRRPGEDGPALRSCVTVADPRLRGLASMILRAEGAPPVASLEEVAGAGVWVAEAEGFDPEEAERFLAACPGRQVVVLGGAVEPAREGLTVLAAEPTTASLRDSLGAAVRECCGPVSAPPLTPSGSAV